MTASRVFALVVFLAAAGSAAHADVWDVGTDNDNDTGTDNELLHGVDQVHDMAAQQAGTVEDVDWFSFRQPCNASYEILLDDITGDLGSNSLSTPALEMLASDGTTVIGTALPLTSLGVARRVIYNCTGALPEYQAFVRVSAPLCGLSCTSADQYHIRVRETSVFVPRFNNSATQVSVLVLQNTTTATVAAALVAYDATGAVIDYSSLSLGPSQVSTFNLSTVSGGIFAGKSGALKIVNGGPYGALAGKVVAVEPATGFTFDTAISYKPY